VLYFPSAVIYIKNVNVLMYACLKLIVLLDYIGAQCQKHRTLPQEGGTSTEVLPKALSHFCASKHLLWLPYCS